MASIIIPIVVGLAALAIGMLVGYILRKSIGEKTIGNAEQKARNLILDAENRAETLRKEKILEAKEEAHRQRSEAEREIRERRNEIQKSERRLIQKEESIDRKLENIEKKEESITNKEKNITNKQQEMERLVSRQLEELEKISGYSIEQAREIILNKVEKEARSDAAALYKEIENKAKEIRKDTIEQVYSANSGHPGGSLSIADIGNAVGYPNQLHFSRAFKNVYGVSPRNWRNENKIE